MPTDTERYLQANQILWDSRVQPHLESAFYDLPAFKAGRSSLNPTELAEVGPVQGKSLLHLQCHFGQDTLSWAREGALATGVDFSPRAIEAAQALAVELSIPATFHCADVLALELNQTFDIVFTSYGTTGWLPDLTPWAATINRHLKPGGRFYIIDFHPLVWMLDDDTFTHIAYSYFNQGPIITQAPSYAQADGPAIPETGWNHSLSEIITSLQSQGLQFEYLHEFPFTPHKALPGLEPHPEGGYHFAHLPDRLPLTYSLSFRKPA